MGGFTEGLKPGLRIGASALMGGISSELSGDNFWRGAAIGGIVAGANHLLHMDPPENEYNGKKYDSKSDLYLAILQDQAMEQYGIRDIMALGGVVSGLPLLDKPFVTKGSTKGTSIASKYLSQIPGEFPTQMKTPTGVPKMFGGSGMRMSGTKLVGRFVGRWVPIVGWGTLIYDTGSVFYNTQKIYNRITNIK